MTLTISTVKDYVNEYFRDASTDSVSDTKRIQAINEATVWLMEQTQNDHVIKTYDIDYVTGIHYYKITSAVADMLEPADLRRSSDDQTIPATRKSSREMAEDIGNKSPEFAFSIERKNGNSYLVINLDGNYNSNSIATFDSLTGDGGTWTADTSTSDAANARIELTEITEGYGSLEFDIVAAQSGNNRATVYSTITEKDLSEYIDTGIFTIDVFIPDSTYTSSVTLYWGTDSSNYWSLTQTTDAQGNAISDGWNTFKFDWKDSTMTSSPDESSINYIRIDVNYAAGQTNDTGYRIDNLNIAHTERLVFYYLSSSVGTTSGGTPLYRYTATTDIPYYSGQYDNYMYPVAHKAAAILFRFVGLMSDAKDQDKEAMEGLVSKIKLFPSSVVKEDRSFKTKQINLSRNRRRF